MSAPASIHGVCVCHVLYFILWAELHSPKHRRPLSDSTKPGGQTHWKLPGVLVHVPKRQMLGSSSHSLISGSIADVLLTEQPKVTPFFVALKPGEVVISGELCCPQVTALLGDRDPSPNPEPIFRADGTMKWSRYSKNTDPPLSWEQLGLALCPVISRGYLEVATHAQPTQEEYGCSESHLSQPHAVLEMEEAERQHYQCNCRSALHTQGGKCSGRSPPGSGKCLGSRSQAGSRTH